LPSETKEILNDMKSNYRLSQTKRENMVDDLAYGCVLWPHSGSEALSRLIKLDAATIACFRRIDVALLASSLASSFSTEE
jgi:hypothetical protein